MHNKTDNKCLSMSNGNGDMLKILPDFENNFDNFFTMFSKMIQEKESWVYGKGWPWSP